MSLYGWQLGHVPDDGEGRLESLKRRHIHRALKFHMENDMEALASSPEAIRHKALQSLLRTLADEAPEHAEALSLLLQTHAPRMIPLLAGVLDGSSHRLTGDAEASRCMEVALAAAVLQGICLAFKRDVVAASGSTRQLSQALLRECRLQGAACQACLDALLALLANSATESAAFVLEGGLPTLCEVALDRGAERDAVARSLEVLLLTARLLHDRQGATGAGALLDRALALLDQCLGDAAAAAVRDFVASPQLEARLAWSTNALWEAIAPGSVPGSAPAMAS